MKNLWFGAVLRHTRATQTFMDPCGPQHVYAPCGHFSLLFSMFFLAWSHRLAEGKTKEMNNQQEIQWRGPHLAEGKTKEKSLRSPTASKPYYTMLDYGQGHHLVHTDSALYGSLTNPGSQKQMWSGSLIWGWSGVWEGSGAEFQPRGGVKSGTVEVWDGVSPNK